MKHLLGLEGLSAAEVTRFLDAAERFAGVGVGDVPKRDDLKGKVVVNLFYEASTPMASMFFAVSMNVSPFAVLEPLGEKSSVSAPSRRAARPKLTRVRVDAS